MFPTANASQNLHRYLHDTDVSDKASDKWQQVIEDAELQIKKYQKRIRALKRAIDNCKEFQKNHEPWPEKTSTSSG